MRMLQNDNLGNNKIMERYIYYNTLNINIKLPNTKKRSSAILSLTYGTSNPMLAIVSLVESQTSMNESTVFYLNKKDGVTVSVKCEDTNIGKYRIKVYNESNMGVHVGCIVFNCDDISYTEQDT